MDQWINGLNVAVGKHRLLQDPWMRGKERKGEIKIMEGSHKPVVIVWYDAMYFLVDWGQPRPVTQQRRVSISF